MCELCGTPEEKLKRQKELETTTRWLNDLALLTYQLASGKIKPHDGDGIKRIVQLSRLLMRELVFWI